MSPAGDAVLVAAKRYNPRSESPQVNAAYGSVAFQRSASEYVGQEEHQAGGVDWQ